MSADVAVGESGVTVAPRVIIISGAQRRQQDQNFEQLYAPCVDSWALYDNSGAAPVLLQWGEKP